MTKTNIKLTCDAYWENSLYSDRGEYVASAVDSSGNHYLVKWDILDSYDENTMEEDVACNWAEPYIIVNDLGEDVTDRCIIVV